MSCDILEFRDDRAKTQSSFLNTHEKRYFGTSVVVKLTKRKAWLKINLKENIKQVKNKVQ